LPLRYSSALGIAAEATPRDLRALTSGVSVPKSRQDRGWLTFRVIFWLMMAALGAAIIYVFVLMSISE